MNLDLQKQIHLYKSIVDSLPYSTGVFDKDLRYLYINKAAEDLAGDPSERLTAEDVFGKTPNEVLPRDICDSFVPLLKKSIETKEIVIERVEFNFSGNEVILNLTYIPMLNKNNDIDYIIALTEDWTKQENERTEAIANTKLASLGHMAANITHEINNPMQLIQLRLFRLEEMIEDSESKESMLEEIKSIFRTTDRVSKIVESVRRQTRRNSEDGVMITPVQEIVDQTVTYSKNIIEKAKAEFLLEVESGLKVNCNSLEIEQVLINLISNACDAISLMEKPWVKLKVFSREDHICFQVIDSGLGIDENIQKKLMEPFFTTKSVGSTAGTGLGLNLSKALVQRNAGQLSYLPEQENTTFEILLNSGSNLS